MSTLHANSLIVEAARRLKDQRPTAGAESDTDANGNVRRYSSAILTEYLNRSVRDLIKSIYDSAGAGFASQIPEYMDRATFAINSSVVKTAAQWHFIELLTDDGLVQFSPLKGDVVKVISGRDKLISPSVIRPVFWEEAGSLFVFPATNGSLNWTVKGRFIKTHQDITVDTSPTDNGNVSTAPGGYISALRELTLTMGTGFASTDINKRIFFWSATAVYAGIIDTVPLANSVTLRGDGLPGGNITSPSVLGAVVSSLSADTNDLQLNAAWDGQLLDRMVDLARGDAFANKAGAAQ